MYFVLERRSNDAQDCVVNEEERSGLSGEL